MKINTATIMMSVILPFCMLFGFAACEKNTNNKPKAEHPLNAKDDQNKTTGTFKARLIKSFCAYNIVQVLDSTFYKNAMDWTDSKGYTYQHVFTVKNHCDFSKAKIKPTDTFDCSIVYGAIDTNCSFCEGFMETPRLQYNILVGR